MNNEDEGKRANLRSNLKNLGISKEEIISITNFVDDYNRRHKPKFSVVVTVGDAVELMTNNSLILIRGTTDFGDPLKIKETKPDTTFAFFDQYSLQGVKRALSSPHTGEALKIDDLVSLNDFIQASLLHDLVVHGDIFFSDEEGESELKIESQIDSTISRRVNELPYVYEDYILHHADDTLSLQGTKLTLKLPVTYNLKPFDLNMAHFYSLVLDRMSELNGSIYVSGENSKYVKMVRGGIDQMSRALAKRLYDKFRQTLNDRFKETSTELGIVKDRLTMPLFTDYIIAQCADGRTDSILNVVEEIRLTLGDSFRAYAAEFANRLKEASPQKTLELEEEIAKTFDRIISGRKGTWTKVLQPLSFIVALWRFDIPSMISAAKDVEEFIRQLVNASRNASVRLLEDSYTKALEPYMFYEELRRVFRNVSFSREELAKRLGPDTS